MMFSNKMPHSVISLHACMAVSSVAAFGGVKLVHKAEGHLLVTCYNHLRYTFAIVHREVFGREIYKQNADFTAIIGIYRAR